MRVVGYVREAADPASGDSAFSQQEQIRRHVTDHGHQLVAVCADPRSPGQQPSRAGYLSLLGVIAAGAVDAVVVPSLGTFSSDAIVQEIVLWDLQGRGVRIVSTDPSDLALLDPQRSPDPSRMVIRDVLGRVGEHLAGSPDHALRSPEAAADRDVLIQIIEADRMEVSGR